MYTGMYTGESRFAATERKVRTDIANLQGVNIARGEQEGPTCSPIGAKMDKCPGTTPVHFVQIAQVRGFLACCLA
jgi:hypothetical protein